MSKSIRQFFNTFGHFTIFKVAQAAVKILDLFLSSLHQVLYLFRSKTYPPEQAPVFFSLESKIKGVQALGILECVQVFFHARLDETDRLRKNLNDQTRPPSLFQQ